MKTLLIIGAGQYGHLVRELAFECGYEKVDFLDDNSSEAIGRIDAYEEFIKLYGDFIVAIGNPSIRKRVTEQLEKSFHLVSLVHSTAVLSKSAFVEKGCVLEAHTVVNTEAYVGKGTFLNAGAIVNHNSIVNEYCQVDCNAVVAARTIVPKEIKVMSCMVWNER